MKEHQAVMALKAHKEVTNAANNIDAVVRLIRDIDDVYFECEVLDKISEMLKSASQSIYEKTPF